MNKLSIIIGLLVLMFSSCTMNNLTHDHTMSNICESYANQQHTKISYPEREYEVNGLKILESKLKQDCKNYGKD